jgi:hypothetical protein
MKKKLMVLALAVVLVMTLATPVFAYRPTDDDDYWRPWLPLVTFDDYKIDAKLKNRIVSENKLAGSNFVWTQITLDTKAENVNVIVKDARGNIVTGVSVVSLGSTEFLIFSMAAFEGTISVTQTVGKKTNTVAEFTIK